MNPSPLNVWCFFEAEMKEDSSASLFRCITKRSLSVSAATCLQYAVLWVIALWIVRGVRVCVCACACMCVCVFLQSWGRSAVQWGVPSCWCPRSSSSSGSCVRRIWYVSPHPLHAPPAPPPPPDTDIILHKSSWQAGPALIYYASSVECASAHPYCLSHTKQRTCRVKARAGQTGILNPEINIRTYFCTEAAFKCTYSLLLLHLHVWIL